MNHNIIIVIALAFCAGCAGPTKAGKEARAFAHQRMDAVNADLAAQQAMQQFEVGQLDNAIETIDAAIERFNSNAKYHLLKGRILFEQHRLDMARQSFEQTIELDPKLAEPHYFLGVLYQRWSDDQSALASYQQAMQTDPSHPQYIMATAETLVALGRHEEAIRLLHESGKEFQHQPAVPSLLGQIYLSLGDAKNAARYLSDSVLLGNDDLEALTSLATAQFHAGLYLDCLVTLDQMDEREDGLIPAFSLMKGKTLATIGRLIDGRDICLEVTRKSPENVGAWIDLGYIAWEMGDYARVKKCGIQISQLAPSLPQGSLFEGIAALHAGQKVRALRLLSQVQTDNKIEGMSTLLASLGLSSNTGQETPFVPNMQADSAEGITEQTESNSSIVHVPLDSTHAP